MNVFSKFAGAVALAACMTAMSVAPANAALIININGGAAELTEPTNTSAVYVSPAIGVFNVVVALASGELNLADPNILDVQLLLNSTGAGFLTVAVTETDLSTAGLLARFQTSFTGNFVNVSVTRSLYLDTTNSGLLTTLLYSTASNGVFLSALQGITGPFSITEVIDVTATGQALVSSDDLTSVVPEPGSVALLALGLLALFGFAMMRRRASAY